MFNTLFPSNSLFLVTNTLVILMIQSSFWTMSSRSSSIKAPAKNTIFAQQTRTSGLDLKGASTALSAIFFLLVMINLIGLVPYTFSTSSHLTLTLGLPIWLSLILSSFTFNPKKTAAHFVPDGAPDWLNALV